jgi:hypothetical protein
MSRPYDNPVWKKSNRIGKKEREIENEKGFLRCQTLTCAVRPKVEGCRVKNEGCGIDSEKWRM